MTTSTAIELIPPPMEITFDTSTDLPTCHANLMPFSIDYDGPAPVNSFLVLRPSESTSDSPAEGSSSASESQSYISAFRGRAIQSTPLPLPAGFQAKIVSISQVTPASTASSAANGKQNGAEVEGREREQKRQRVAKPPARQQKFSMDSDDDDAASDHDDDERSPSPPAPMPTEQETDAKKDQVKVVVGERREKIRIEMVATVEADELRMWGPDGPIDKGDDTFFRTIGEWYAVVTPILHS